MASVWSLKIPRISVPCCRCLQIHLGARMRAGSTMSISTSLFTGIWCGRNCLTLKKQIKRGMHKAGFDLHRLSPHSNPAFQLLKGLERFGVDLVFDVGANTGQFASELRSIGYKGRIVSF